MTPAACPVSKTTCEWIFMLLMAKKPGNRQLNFGNVQDSRRSLTFDLPTQAKMKGEGALITKQPAVLALGCVFGLTAPRLAEKVTLKNRIQGLLSLDTWWWIFKEKLMKRTVSDSAFVFDLLPAAYNERNLVVDVKEYKFR